MNKTEQKTLTGQPQPISIDFETLRKNALETPMLKSDFTADEINLERHCKIIDYSNNYLLAIIVLCVLRDNAFQWEIQTCFVSKSSAKQVKVSLLNKRQREALKQAKVWALGESGRIESEVFQTKPTAYVWQTILSEKDYEMMDSSFLELVKK